VTILVCLGPTPDTWWQAKNWIGRQVLDRAEQLAPDEDVKAAIFMGNVVQTLTLYEMASPLREHVWATLEQAAKEISIEAEADPDTWPREWMEHVAELAREMEAQRDDPDRPGAWPNKG
jgi:hypothetical protein